MPTARGQSAMESLMTYAWAAIVLLAVLVVLFYLGAFSPQGATPKSCVFGAGFTCYEYGVDEAGQLYLDLSQATGKQVTVTRIGCGTGVSVAMTDIPDVVIGPGRHAWVASGGSVSCAGAAGSLSYKGKIVIEYTVAGSALTRNASGEINGPVQGSFTFVNEGGGGSGPACVPSYAFRRAVNITGSSSTQSYYQVSVPVTYSANMRADFGDVRFFDANGSALNYWVEAYTPSASATAWVKVPSIPTSGATIYLYYGNASLSSASNASATLIYYDGFNDSAVGGEWANSGVTESGGYMSTSDGQGSQPRAYVNLADRGLDFGQPFRVRFRVYNTEDNSAGERGGWALSTAAPSPGSNAMRSGNFLLYYANDPNNNAFAGWSGYDGAGSAGGPWGAGGWNTAEFRRNGTNILWFFNGAQVANTTPPAWSSPLYFTFGQWETDQSTDANYFDDLVVQKYAAPEPAASVGGEESC